MGGQVCAGLGTLPASKDFQPGFTEQDAGWRMSQRSAVSAPPAPRAQAHSRWVPPGEESHRSHPQPLKPPPFTKRPAQHLTSTQPSAGTARPCPVWLTGHSGHPPAGTKELPQFQHCSSGTPPLG